MTNEKKREVLEEIPEELQLEVVVVNNREIEEQKRREAVIRGQVIRGWKWP